MVLQRAHHIGASARSGQARLRRLVRKGQVAHGPAKALGKGGIFVPESLQQLHGELTGTQIGQALLIALVAARQAANGAQTPNGHRQRQGFAPLLQHAHHDGGARISRRELVLADVVVVREAEDDATRPLHHAVIVGIRIERRRYHLARSTGNDFAY